MSITWFAIFATELDRSRFAFLAKNGVNLIRWKDAKRRRAQHRRHLKWSTRHRRECGKEERNAE